jgi:hypothetical protein
MRSIVVVTDDFDAGVKLCGETLARSLTRAVALAALPTNSVAFKRATPPSSSVLPCGVTAAART